jgi:hypothetical protein
VIEVVSQLISHAAGELTCSVTLTGVTVIVTCSLLVSSFHEFNVSYRVISVAIVADR